jgi:hypothetical protein
MECEFFHYFQKHYKTGCHAEAFAYDQKGEMLTVILKIMLLMLMIKDFCLIAQNSYTVLIVLCCKRNIHPQILAHPQHTSVSTDKEKLSAAIHRSKLLAKYNSTILDAVTYTFLPLVNPQVVQDRMNCRDYVV